MSDKMSEALLHAQARFECIAEDFKAAGDTVSWAMCNVDAERMGKALAEAPPPRAVNVLDSEVYDRNNATVSETEREAVMKQLREQPSRPVSGGAPSACTTDYEREARNLAAVWANGNHGARTCIWAALLRAAAAPERPLAALILEYAYDLRRNSSGSDDYPWEWAKATADYLETLIERSGLALSPHDGNTEDIRWAVNVLLEDIASRFEKWETWDVWRSDAAAFVRARKHDLAAPAVSRAQCAPATPSAPGASTPAQPLPEQSPSGLRPLGERP